MVDQFEGIIKKVKGCETVTNKQKTWNNKHFPEFETLMQQQFQPVRAGFAIRMTGFIQI